MFRSAFGYDVDAASNESALVCLDQSKALQSQKEESDINTIVKRFGLTGQIPQSLRLPTYGDFTGITDYRTALEAVRYGEEAFMSLPASIRVEFNNDPEAFIEFCSNSANRDKLKEMGLLKDEPAQKEGLAPTEQPAGEPPATGGGTA